MTVPDPSWSWRLGLHAQDLDEDGHLPAAEVTYDNATSGLAADDVQAAIDELVAGGGGGAPTTADYLVGTAQAGLSAEIVVGTTPGGELGGTWASPTVDPTHAGSTHLAIGTTGSTAAAGNDARLSDARTPTGPAGGDLSGTYPNPSVVDDSHAHTAATIPTGATAADAHAWMPLTSVVGGEPVLVWDADDSLIPTFVPI